MPKDRTYTKWKKQFREELLKECENNGISQDYVESFSQKISKLLQDHEFDKDATNAMLYGFCGPIVGLRWVAEKMLYWRNFVNTVQGVCERPDGSLFKCPDNVTDETRLLSAHQDSAILLLSILFQHEGLYKSIVNFTYSLTGDGRYKDHQTTRQADHLANAGLDIREAVDKELRNSIAHMSFHVADSGDVLAYETALFPKGFNAASGKTPPGVKVYRRNELIDIHNRSDMILTKIFAATQYWFNYNHGPLRLFDDEFFETSEGNEIRKRVIKEMVNKPNIDHWHFLVNCAREELRRVTN